ncbi:MAG TPA: SDR family NAD(P)-dependent oxidoreductase [Rhodospirillales bacterium]
MGDNIRNPQAILITGASSGIGEALARRYAGPGRFLALSGRDRRRLDAVAEACRAKGANVEGKIVDAADRDLSRRWIEAVDTRRPLDLVIANAGVSAGTGGRGESEAQCRDIFAVNLGGVLNTVWPAIDRMRGRRCGQIAIVSSIAAFRGLPGTPAYSASKAAVKAYGEALRGWLGKDGIRVSVVCPGFIRSRMTAPNKFPMPMIMDADKAARIIAKGLARDKARIAFPWPMVALMWLLGALPPAWTDPILKVAPEKE